MPDRRAGRSSAARRAQSTATVAADHVVPSRASARSVGRQQPVALAVGERGPPGAQARLREEVVDVALNRADAQDELLADLAVGEAPRQEDEHLELARRQ